MINELQGVYNMKERLEEMVEIPIGKCDCINAHHKSVILEAIDTSMGSYL